MPLTLAFHKYLNYYVTKNYIFQESMCLYNLHYDKIIECECVYLLYMRLVLRIAMFNRYEI